MNLIKTKEDNVDLSLYDEDGRITHTISASPSTYNYYVSSGERYVLGHHDRDTSYVNTKSKEVMLRHGNPAQLSGLMLTGLPVPCSIWVDTTEYPCTEPQVELSLPYPVVYTVKVVAFPYLDVVFTIDQRNNA